MVQQMNIDMPVESATSQVPQRASLSAPQKATASQRPVRAGAITLRLADNMDDCRRIIDLGRMLHAESDFSDLPFEDAKVLKLAERAMTPQGRGRTCALMAERKSLNGEAELAGMLIGNANEYYFSSAIAATAMMFYVRPDCRGGMAAVKLLHGFRNWARNRQARSISINVTSGIHMARTDKMLKRLGFKTSGGNYALEISNDVPQSSTGN